MPTLLHIDDDTFLRNIIRGTFVRAGWEVIAATNGEEGYEQAQLHRPDLILLDIRMPKRDGFETLQALKQDPELQTIPVIMLSTLGSKEDVSFCLQQGAIDYFVKGHHSPEEIEKRARFYLDARKSN